MAELKRNGVKGGTLCPLYYLGRSTVGALSTYVSINISRISTQAYTIREHMCDNTKGSEVPFRSITVLPEEKDLYLVLKDRKLCEFRVQGLKV